MMNSTSDSCKNSTHLLLRLVHSLEPVGTIWLVYTPGYYKLRQLAVLKDYRQHSFGRALVLELHDWVRANAIRSGRNGEVKTWSHSLIPVRGFYAK